MSLWRRTHLFKLHQRSGRSNEVKSSRRDGSTRDGLLCEDLREQLVTCNGWMRAEKQQMCYGPDADRLETRRPNTKQPLNARPRKTTADKFNQNKKMLQEKIKQQAQGTHKHKHGNRKLNQAGGQIWHKKPTSLKPVNQKNYQNIKMQIVISRHKQGFHVDPFCFTFTLKWPFVIWSRFCRNQRVCASQTLSKRTTRLLWKHVENLELSSWKKQTAAANLFLI